MKRMIGGCLLLCSSLTAKTQEKPNIVIFIADDVRCDGIGRSIYPAACLRCSSCKGEDSSGKYRLHKHTIPA